MTDKTGPAERNCMRTVRLTLPCDLLDDLRDYLHNYNAWLRLRISTQIMALEAEIEIRQWEIDRLKASLREKTADETMAAALSVHLEIYDPSEVPYEEQEEERHYEDKPPELCEEDKEWDKEWWAVKVADRKVHRDPPIRQPSKNPPRESTKHSRYRQKCKEEGRCPHCGKPCAPYHECEERHKAKTEGKVTRRRSGGPNDTRHLPRPKGKAKSEADCQTCYLFIDRRQALWDFEVCQRACDGAISEEIKA